MSKRLRRRQQGKLDRLGAMFAAILLSIIGFEIAAQAPTTDSALVARAPGERAERAMEPSPPTPPG